MVTRLDQVHSYVFLTSTYTYESCALATTSVLAPLALVKLLSCYTYMLHNDGVLWVQQWWCHGRIELVKMIRLSILKIFDYLCLYALREYGIPIYTQFPRESCTGIPYSLVNSVRGYKKLGVPDSRWHCSQLQFETQAPEDGQEYTQSTYCISLWITLYHACTQLSQIWLHAILYVCS